MKICLARDTIYNKIFSALDDSYPARKEAAAIMTHHAVLNGVDPSLSAFQIIEKSHKMSAAIAGIRQARQSKEEDPSGVPDKKIPQSALGNDYESCLSSLQKIGVSADRAKNECETQWKGTGTVSGKTKKAVMDNILKRYPNLTRESVNAIVNETIKEASLSNKSIRQASLENQVPSWITATNTEIDHLQDSSPVTSTHLKSASVDERKQYFDAITQSHGDNMRERAVRDDEQSKIKSANLEQEKRKSRPKWSEVIDADL
jgi:hypothetical protein